MTDAPEPAPTESTTRGRRSGRGRDRSSSRFTPKQIAVVVVLVLVAVFCAQNTQSVTIQFFSGEFESPLWLWLLGVLVVGVVAGLLLPFGRGRKG